jgi:hypothetical protein
MQSDGQHAPTIPRGALVALALWAMNGLVQLLLCWWPTLSGQAAPPPMCCIGFHGLMASFVALTSFGIVMARPRAYHWAMVGTIVIVAVNYLVGSVTGESFGNYHFMFPFAIGFLMPVVCLVQLSAHYTDWIRWTAVKQIHDANLDEDDTA